MIENNEKKIDPNYLKFCKSMYKELKGNKYPIVIIEDFNGGGFIESVFFLLNTINSILALNSLNFATKIEGDNIPYEIDNYGNGITHKRSKIQNMYFRSWDLTKKKKNLIQENQMKLLYLLMVFHIVQLVFLLKIYKNQEMLLLLVIMVILLLQKKIINLIQVNHQLH